MSQYAIWQTVREGLEIFADSLDIFRRSLIEASEARPFFTHLSSPLI